MIISVENIGTSVFIEYTGKPPSLEETEYYLNWRKPQLTQKDADRLEFKDRT